MNKLSPLLSNYINVYSSYLNVNFKNTICPDQFVGVIHLNKKNEFEWYDCYVLLKDRTTHASKVNNPIKINNNNENIIIILESPHIDEFNGPIIGPLLNKKTGKAFRKYFPELLTSALSNLPSNNKYNVILMNSIQYQCSLGIDTKVFRDRVWLTLWFKKSIRNNFYYRLSSYNPKIIINLCTNGDHTLDPNNIKNSKKNINKYYLSTIDINPRSRFRLNKNLLSAPSKKYKLKDFVQYLVNHYFNKNPSIMLFQGPHPASWGRIKKNHKYFKKI